MPAMPSRFKYADRKDLFEMVETEFSAHPMERWRAEGIACGMMGAYAEYMKEFQTKFDALRSDAAIIRNDAVALEEKQQAVQDTALKIVDFVQRVDALVGRVEALEEKQRRQDELNAEPLSAPPGEVSDTEEDEPPNKSREASQGDDGDLEINPPKVKEPVEDDDELEDLPENPELEPELDDPEDSDLELAGARLPRHIGKDTEEGPEFAFPEIEKQPQVQQPTVIE